MTLCVIEVPQAEFDLIAQIVQLIPFTENNTIREKYSALNFIFHLSASFREKA